MKLSYCTGKCLLNNVTEDNSHFHPEIDIKVLSSSLSPAEYNSSDSMFNLRYNSAGGDGVTGARYVVTFRDSTSGEDVTVNVGISLRMLDFIFQAPEFYKDGSTRGLYGRCS